MFLDFPCTLTARTSFQGLFSVLSFLKVRSPIEHMSSPTIGMGSLCICQHLYRSLVVSWLATLPFWLFIAALSSVVDTLLVQYLILLLECIDTEDCLILLLLWLWHFMRSLMWRTLRVPQFLSKIVCQERLSLLLFDVFQSHQLQWRFFLFLHQSHLCFDLSDEMHWVIIQIVIYLVVVAGTTLVLHVLLQVVKFIVHIVYFK